MSRGGLNKVVKAQRLLIAERHEVKGDAKPEVKHVTGFEIISIPQCGISLPEDSMKY